MRLKPFKCPEPNCSHFSASKGNLKIHQRNHTRTTNDQLYLVKGALESENVEELEASEGQMTEKGPELVEDSQSSDSGVNQVQGNF